MKKVLSLFAAAACAVVVSCSKDDSSSPENTVSGEIFFTAEGEGIEASVETKATAVTSLSKSGFNVNCVTGTAGTSESSVFNAAFSLQQGGETSFAGGKYWPSTDAGYKFYAANVAMTPAATGPTVTATNATDIVCAVCTSPTYKASNALTFNHIFARLGKTTVTVQDGYILESFTLKITPKTSGTYNLYTGNGKTDGTGWSSTSDGSAVTLATASGENAATDTYLVPGSYDLKATYTLKKDAYSVTKTDVTKSVAITGGKINAIKATLGGASATEIVFTVSITPWGDPVEKTVTFE